MELKDTEILLDSPHENERVKGAVNLRFFDPLHVIELYRKGFSDSSVRVRKGAIESLELSFKKQILPHIFSWIGDHENATLRSSALEFIKRKRNAFLDELLKRAQEEKDPEVKKFIVDALHGLREPRVIKLLKSLLCFPDANVKAAAVECLSSSGNGETVKYLLKELKKKKDPFEQFTIIEALSILGEKGFKLPVGNFLKGFLEDPVLRKAVIRYLGFSRTRKSLPLIKYMMKKYPQDVVHFSRAVNNLSRDVKEKVIRESLQVDRVTSQNFLRYTKKISFRLTKEDRLSLLNFARLSGWGKELLHLIKSFSFDFEDAETISGFFTSLGDFFLKWAKKNLNKLPPPLTAGAIIAIGALKGGEIFKNKLLKFSRGEEMDIFFPYYLHACSLSPHPSIAPLMGKIFSKASPGDKEHIKKYFYSLGEKLRGRKEVERIFNAMERSSNFDKILLLNFIKGSRLRKGISFMKRNAGSSEEDVRKEIAEIAGIIKMKESLEILKNYLRDESPEVRKKTIESLGLYPLEKSLPLLAFSLRDENEEVRGKAVNIIGEKCGGKGIEILSTALSDISPYVAISAANIISRKANRRNNLHRYLIDALYHKDEEVVIETMNFLRNFLWDRKVREALESIKREGLPRASVHAEMLLRDLRIK